MTLTRRPFWTDALIDPVTVAACPAAPRHRWVTLRLGDVLEAPHNPDELLTLCSSCYVKRCGIVADEPDRCALPMGHRSDQHHRREDGRRVYERVAVA